MEKRYKALRVFGTVYKVLGIIVLTLTVLGSAAICIIGFAGGAMAQQMMDDVAGGGMAAGVAGLIMAASTLLGGAISGLSLYAMGEGIYLLINIEENTRATAALLRQSTSQ